MIPTAIPDLVLTALEQPGGYSREFTAHVAEIATRISQAIGKKNYVHDDDMNYNLGQSISFDWKSSGLNIKTRFYISSRANLYALYIFDTDGKYSAETTRHPLNPKLLPRSISDDLKKAHEVLKQLNYKEVPYEIFFLKTPHTLTQMDDLPASVFEGLFAEIV